ncbi:FecR family protein [Sphingobacterium faecale]|uniref:FecR family protein n=1 Tax=Sphingobacterium faecale TaxID=2803775 RepID=A0ABS1R467_9SPHI|nr:FecR family protein [Sphingobacterium faecale]MBL1409458.1 FecR family protein [Sphingobacterium faecale]
MKRITKELLYKYINGESTIEEINSLLFFLKEEDIDFDLLEDLQNKKQQAASMGHVDDRLEKVLLNIKNEIAYTSTYKPFNFKVLYTAAASLILLIGFYAIFVTYFGKIEEREVMAEIIQPKASIKFGNGEVQHLDNIDREAKEGRSLVVLDSSGFMSLGKSESSHETISYNTLKTPAREIIKFILPDGSKLWLNANSELEFPDRFSSNERRIKLTGEGYFEIQKSKLPFIIETNNQELKVLGTQFNLTSYKDDNSDVTTLIEGSVGVMSKHDQDGRSTILKNRGEQLVLNKTIQKITMVDLESYTGWKEGWFIFHQLSLHEMCKQIANWYGLDLDFRIKTTNSYYGEIKRNVSLEEVMGLIEGIADVKLQKHGNILKVYK